MLFKAETTIELIPYPWVGSLEFDCIVEFDWDPGLPAKTYGSPENCDPGAPSSVEVHHVLIHGTYVPLENILCKEDLIEWCWDKGYELVEGPDD